MKECVELVEAVERTGCIYALAENYPYFRANMEMEEVYQAGALGDVIFAEGEYVHPMSRQENEFYNPGPKHWRSLTPCTYYCTHAMAPLMKITNLMPKKVIGKVAVGRQYAEEIGAKAADNYCSVWAAAVDSAQRATGIVLAAHMEALKVSAATWIRSAWS